jgi:hypothetical protein
LADEVLGGGVGAGVLNGVLFLLGLLFTSFELSAELALLAENDSGSAGTSGMFPRFACRTGTVCERFPDVLTGRCCTTLGEADDHDVGVVIVVDSLQGLLELDSHVDGLSIELVELFRGTWYRADDAASACSSGISRGGRSACRVADVVLGMTMPKIASLSVSKEDSALLETSGSRAVRPGGGPSSLRPFLRSESIIKGTSCDNDCGPQVDLPTEDGAAAFDDAVGLKEGDFVVDLGMDVGFERGFVLEDFAGHMVRASDR